MKKVFFLVCLIAFITATVQAQPWKQKNKFTKKIGKLNAHPVEISLKGPKDNVNYYFYVTDEGLFFTEKKEIFKEISDYLPAKEIPGRFVELHGTTLRPFTKFSRSQLGELSRAAGRSINKRADAIRISGYYLKSKKIIETFDANGNPVVEN